MDYFGKLPDDITFEILIRVPADSVLNCKLVHKSWNNILSQDSFTKKHVQLHVLDHPSTSEDSGEYGFLALTDHGFCYFDYKEKYDENGNCYYGVEKIRQIIGEPNLGGKKIYIVGSCNGLVCIANGFEPKRPVCIWNPLNKECVVLPEIRTGLFDKYDEFSSWSIGFGYISLKNEYKVVAIYESKSRSSYVEVYIYTLGSGNGWRDLGRNFSSEFTPNLEHGSFANGAIYWISNTVEVILTFDLIHEKFREHLAPPALPPRVDLFDQTIGVLDGSLYLAVAIFIYVGEGYGYFEYDIWLLKKKNDNNKKHQSFGWRKEYNRVAEDELVAVTKSVGVLSYTYGESYVNIYDIKASTTKSLVEFKDEVYQVFPHKHTFISLRQLCKEMEEVPLHETKRYDHLTSSYCRM